VILFGSHAYGSPGPYSDVDLLVVLPFEGRNFWKSLEILNRVDPPFPVDLLARRPDDTARRYAEGDPLVCSAAFDVQRCGSSSSFSEENGKAARLKCEPCATLLACGSSAFAAIACGG